MASYLADALQWKKIVIAWLPIALCIAGTVGLFLGNLTANEWTISSSVFAGIGTSGVVVDGFRKNGAAKKGEVVIVGKR